VGDPAPPASPRQPGGGHAGYDIGLGGLGLGLRVDDSALVVGDHALVLVEGQLRQLRARIADRPIDGVDVPVAEVPGAVDPAGPVALLPLGAPTAHLILPLDG